ncbi:GFA family protein [Pseudomonas sp. PDNC002]|uniref:GFA family protein n=1 Tax=Pseudomonas sp. PDNC002 TaxID=2811422 RepID=UPI00196642DF|nr:GFA family protein [Pseudomonas sp. PDNC002]QRY77818.1 GFA family protein [Pseudomonas sp. PDNC002]
MKTLQGTCLCGSVQYSSSQAPTMTAVCHCSDCQKQSGSAFSVNVMIPAEGFQVNGLTLASYRVQGGSGMQVRRFFCSHCGSPLYTEMAAMPGVLAVKAGTLRNSSTVTPNLHVWCASAQPWVAIDPSLPRFEHTPS